MKWVYFVWALLLCAAIVLPVQDLNAGGAKRKGAGLVPIAQASPLPGMPPVLDPHDIYSADRAGDLSPVVKDDPSRVYVPNSGSNTVDVIDPATYKIIKHFRVGRQPQHVTPSFDLKTLWVLNDLGDSLTRIDPATGKKGATFKVVDPYNMYYTPDGKYAIVVAERKDRLDFINPQTLKLDTLFPCLAAASITWIFPPTGVT